MEHLPEILVESRKLQQDAEQWLKSMKQQPAVQETTPPESEPVFTLTPVGKSSNLFQIFPDKARNDRADIITFVETFYQIHRTLPNRADFVEQKHLNLPEFNDIDAWQELTMSLQEPLQARGIPAYTTPVKYLEPNFVLAVNLVTNPLDKRSIPAKLKEAGISTKQWSTFLLNDDHYQYYKDRLNTIFDEQTQLDAKLALQRLISQGDLQAIKHFHELQNIYRPQDHNYNQQLITIIQGIMEVLAVYVEPKVIAIIQQELRSSKAIVDAIAS